MQMGLLKLNAHESPIDSQCTKWSVKAAIEIWLYGIAEQNI
jgi:hypothetical protein